MNIINANYQKENPMENNKLISEIEKLPILVKNAAALEKVLETIKNTKINVLLIGGTGAGKSSTINALFHTSDIKTEARATVGEGANPETMDIHRYELNNMVIWDTPGLGDSTKKDQRHQQKIIDLLKRSDDQGRPLIDLIILILDGSSRDFSSAYMLIKDVVAPHLQEDDKGRLLIGINKADKVMHHSFWDSVTNQPKPELIAKLDDLSETVRKRISDDTRFNPDVIYYSAGETYEERLIQEPYNLAKLLNFIIDHLPKKKRIAVASDINQNSSNFNSNDGKENYQGNIEKKFSDSFLEIIKSTLEKARDYALDILQEPTVKEAIANIVSRFFKSRFGK